VQDDEEEEDGEDDEEEVLEQSMMDHDENISKHSVDTAKISTEDEDVFKSICGGNLMKKLAGTPSNQTQLIYTSLDHFLTRKLVKITGLLCMVKVGSHMCLNHSLLGNT
jgi:hypothetical protein